MPSSPDLLGMPRELRDMIYKEYARTKHGYLFNFRTGKLTAEQNRPIDLSLMYTCRLIAEEMLAAVFEVNTIVFELVNSSELLSRVSRFSIDFTSLQTNEIDILRRVSTIITPSMANSVLNHFPQFRAQMDLSSTNPVGRFLQISADRDSLKEAPSMRRSFIRHLLLKAQEHYRFWEFATDLGRIDLDPTAILSVGLAPWAVPSDEELDLMEQALGAHIGSLRSYTSLDLHWRQGESGFSAASAAIQFLYSIPEAVRSLVRNVLLLEDTYSVAYPQCHVQGLIPLCVENSQLRIARRVSLWSTMLDDLSGNVDLSYISSEGLSGRAIHQAIVPWILEAAGSPSLGMPAGSFTFIIDGTSSPRRSSKIFEVVKRDTRWRLEYEEDAELGVALCPIVD